MNISVKQITKLKTNSVPITVATSLDVIYLNTFPTILHFISILAVVPLTSCEAERYISSSH